MTTNSSQPPPDQTNSEEEQPLIGQDPDQWEESLEDEVCQYYGVRGEGERSYDSHEPQDGGGSDEDGGVGEGGEQEGGGGEDGEPDQNSFDKDAQVAEEDDQDGEWF